MNDKTMKKATASFEMAGWKEDTVTQLDGEAKLTRVTSKSVYTGDLEGTSEVEYLMHYVSAKLCSYVGFERFSGRLGGRSGSFVLRVEGLFAGDTAESHWTVFEGSGTGELANLKGHGGYAAKHEEKSHKVTLDYGFA